ncbi:MAG TPA: hypothetical protein VKP08_03120 [Anaerolineales bacterium]|nr:hypothetical protein [Anaerolineales bacterium]
MKLSNEKLKQTKQETEQADIVSFRDVPTLRKLIAAFEDDLQESREAEQEATTVNPSGARNKSVRT